MVRTKQTARKSTGRQDEDYVRTELVSWKEGEYLTSGKPMPRGKVVVGRSYLTNGYFNNESKTEEVYKVDENGMRWFYTDNTGLAKCAAVEKVCEIVKKQLALPADQELTPESKFSTFGLEEDTGVYILELVREEDTGVYILELVLSFVQINIP
ncbi:hypothetical protein AgCh_034295 [Apium graveolens]